MIGGIDMSIKRVISTILLVVMCAALLFGCNEPEKELDYSNLAPGIPFSAEQKAEVSRAMKRDVSWVDEDGRYMYFGVFDGAMVVYDIGGAQLTVITDVRIGGRHFEFPTNVTPTVIFEGKVYGFEESYKEGILSANAVAQIHAYFTSDQYREDRYGIK